MAKKGKETTILLRDLTEEDIIVLNKLQEIFSEKTYSKTVLKTIHAYISERPSTLKAISKIEKLQNENTLLHSRINEFLKALKGLKKIK